MKSRTVKVLCGAAASLAVACLGLNPALADQEIGLQYKMPVHVVCNVTETGCYNSPGPQITLDGEIALGGLQVQLVFKNNVKGTHTTQVTFSTNMVLLDLGHKIVIPKQPVLGGVGGNPHIWLQFLDGKGKDLSGEIYLGRCVQGLTIGGDFLNDVIGATTVTSDGCENNPGPVITFGGNLTLSGLKARIIFRNNVKGTHIAESCSDVNIIVEGAPVTIPKSPAQGGAGGNPLIYIQFQHCDGEAITPQLFLGRCNKI